MKRFAAHYIYFSPGRFYKLHYIELTADNRLAGVSPLDGEMAQTAFYNGTLVVKQSAGSDAVEVYHLDSTDLAAAELCANHGGSDSHVQRLC